MNETPLASIHRQLGAKMAEFAGWNMPILYPAGILAEHKHCREAAALFDICHMGEFRLTGPAAAAALDRLLPRSVSSQKPGTCRYNFLPDETGGVLDDLLVYRISPEEFFLVVNAGTASADAAWIQSHLPAAGVSFCDLRSELGKLDLQGPRTFEVLADLGVSQDAIPRYYHWTRVRLFDQDILLSRTGYTGERGVELYFPRGRAVEFWERLTAHPLVKPAGLGARDTLRLEMGYPLYGHELDRQTTPVEAGFGGMLDFQNRDCIGRDALLRGPRKRLTGFRLDGRRAARNGMAVLDPVTRRVVGAVTSGAFSPTLGMAVAMGFVEGAEPPPAGTPFLLGDAAGAGTRLPAVAAPIPFHTAGTARASG